METQMDEHLENVQRYTKVVLDRFAKSQGKLTKPFMDHFRKITLERVTQTCERYSLEVKLKSNQMKSAPKRKSNENERSDTTDMKDSGKKLKSADMKLTDAINSTANKKHDDGNLNDITYFCAYCDFIDTKSHRIDNVYDHWLSIHVNESISKPFRFNAVPSAKCFYCKKIETYHGLVEHHMEKHSEQQFAIFNRSNSRMCGVCQFTNGDLIEHFKLMHDTKLTQKIFNLICYTEERLAKLLKINVNKKLQCMKCDEIFETQDEIVKHFISSHTGHKVQSKEFIGNQNTPAYMMCGCCYKNINSTQMLSHFQNHTYNFNCSQCPKQTEDIAEIICHEKITHNNDSVDKRCKAFQDYVKSRFLNTDIVFNNGLTLKIYNVLETKFDDSKLFTMIIDEFLDGKKEQAKKSIEMIGTNVNENQNYSMTFGVNPAKIIPKLYTSPKQTRSKTGLAVPIHKPEHTTELFEQRRLVKNVYIEGLSNDLNIRNPIGIFLTFCGKLKISMHPTNIDDVIQCQDGIIVKFHELKTKEWFMSQTIVVNIRSNDLILLTVGQKSRKLHVKPHMTEYFHDIFMTAGELRRKHLLHSYKLCENGISIKFTATGALHIVQSKQQLMDLVKKF